MSHYISVVRSLEVSGEWSLAFRVLEIPTQKRSKFLLSLIRQTLKRMAALEIHWRDRQKSDSALRRLVNPLLDSLIDTRLLVLAESPDPQSTWGHMPNKDDVRVQYVLRHLDMWRALMAMRVLDLLHECGFGSLDDKFPDTKRDLRRLILKNWVKGEYGSRTCLRYFLKRPHECDGDLIKEADSGAPEQRTAHAIAEAYEFGKGNYSSFATYLGAGFGKKSSGPSQGLYASLRMILGERPSQSAIELVIERAREIASAKEPPS